MLGVLGLGSRSTTFYIEELNRKLNSILGGYSTCPFVMLNTDFDTINALLPHPSKKLDKIVQRYIEDLEKLKPDSILIPNITLHQTIDRLKVKTKLIHPLQICVEKLKQQDTKKIVVFGTKYTMQSSYFKDYFYAHGIEIIAPSNEDMDFVDKIRQDIYAKREKEKDLIYFNVLIEKYSKLFPVIFACTELSIVKNDKVIDLIQLQIDTAIKSVLKENYN